jgi:phospholipid N-methyltransferase
MLNATRLQLMNHFAYLQQFMASPRTVGTLSIPVRISVRILQQARQRLLARNGTLVLFQYSHLSEKLLSRYFHWKRLRVVRNFPPALVYVCTPR